MIKLKGYVFQSTQGSRSAITTRSLRRRIDSYLEKANLKRSRLSAHALRSTSSTLLLEAGAGIIEIQQHLGHSSPETTMRYLARLDQLCQKSSEKIPVKLT